MELRKTNFVNEFKGAEMIIKDEVSSNAKENISVTQRVCEFIFLGEKVYRVTKQV
jgi:hypothetical protein